MSINNKKILIVEDEPSFSKILAYKLKTAGAIVIVAADGDEALEKAHKEQLDLVLLDLIMPEMSGFDFLEEIRKDERLKDLPVIVLSSLEQELNEEKCRELGVVDYLIKNETPLSRIEEIVDSHL